MTTSQQGHRHINHDPIWVRRIGGSAVAVLAAVGALTIGTQAFDQSSNPGTTTGAEAEPSAMLHPDQFAAAINQAVAGLEPEPSAMLHPDQFAAAIDQAVAAALAG
ncbi:MAG: hypothetical protein GY925_13870 [Actinomycetia bacterium]|nr:hypothetical protein [Actinomycetes bacterium]